jgi:ribonucleoside-diphosphate reductase alpha chain
MRFEPAGWTGNPDIPNAKSIVDYIFRFMGMQFLPGYREANAPKRPDAKGTDGGEDPPESHSKAGAALTTEPATSAKDRLPNAIAHRMNGGAKLSVTGSQLLVDLTDHGPLTTDQRSTQFAKFQSDAPSCDNCGAITVRNGNCYLCHNCGNSLGCS